MQRTDKRSFTEYLAVRRLEGSSTPADTNSLRLDVEFVSDRGYLIAAVPCTEKDNGLVSCIIGSHRFFSLEHAKRFNDKKLEFYAALIKGLIVERNYSENDARVQFLTKTIAEFGLVLVTPYIDMTREEMITAILAASRGTMPQLVERLSSLCTDGQYRFALGLPVGVSFVKPYQSRSEGFVFQHNDGTTHGRLGQTMQQVIDGWNQAQDSKASDFRRSLEAMNDTELQGQADYWLRYLKEKEELRHSISRAA